MIPGFTDPRLASGLGGRLYGVYPAIVTDLADPDSQGRVKVKLPWTPSGDGEPYEAWARLATMMAGNDRGSWFVPDKDDEVLVAFGGGDPGQPFVVGALWNGVDAPPSTMDSNSDNKEKRLRSRNGIQITMTDEDGQESIVIETPGGQKVTLQDGPGTLKLEDSNGNSVEMAPAGITVQSSAKVSVTASTVEVSASMVTVNAGMAQFSGVVQCSTLIATTVVGSTYTPGAGNIW